MIFHLNSDIQHQVLLLDDDSVDPSGVLGVHPSFRGNDKMAVDRHAGCVFGSCSDFRFPESLAV